MITCKNQTQNICFFQIQSAPFVSLEMLAYIIESQKLDVMNGAMLNRSNSSMSLQTQFSEQKMKN